MRRRTALKTAGGVALVALGCAGALFARRTRMVPLPSEPLSYFTPREFSIVHAVAEAMITVPPGQPTVTDVPVALNADRLMARNPQDAQKDIHRLLALFDNALAGFLLVGTTAPFTQLDLAGRQAFLARWERHRLPVLRTGFVALKRLTMACYYGDPRTYRGIGYPGPIEVSP